MTRPQPGNSSEAQKSMYTQARNAVRDFVRARAPYLVRYISTFHLTDDRRVLETIILPNLRDDPDVKRILFVGCEWYTKPCETQFRAKDYWTLDIDPNKRRFGARRHIVDALRNLERHSPANYFDAIICNGVFMKTAIETREDAEASFQACWRCMRPGGWFVLSWNDIEELLPYPPSDSLALQAFVRTSFPPLGVSEYRTDTSYRHTYSFFRRP